jgi:hypothetical protein
MNDPATRPRSKARIVGVVLLYFLYLAVASAIPLLHIRLVNAALEVTRDPILLPAPFLLLKWLSEIAGMLVWIVAGCGLWLCFRPKRVLPVSVVLGVILLAFTTLYGCYAAVLLSSELTHAPFTARLFAPQK